MKINKTEYDNFDFQINLSKEELNNIRNDLGKLSNLSKDSKVFIGLGDLE